MLGYIELSSYYFEICPFKVPTYFRTGPSGPSTLSPQPATAPQSCAIFFDGPFSKPDPKQDGDELPFWTVYLGRDWGDPVRTVYEVNTYKRAEALAQAMSHDRKLELVAEAMPA